ncbi:MAG: methylated-DNA--[protein]-cysteine S-methyltransferase [Aquabacterium sp.]|uniref:methylated-DNA--[protein]-cysteine S-methyltransferase n=1 Tax=Aquabacterium sp. TaxID=1872578 RepID=UPI003BD1066C
MTQVCYVTAPCDLGTVLVAAQGDAVCAIWLGDNAEDLITALIAVRSDATPASAQHEVQRHLAAVMRHLAQPADTPLPTLKLVEHGTAFQQQVWAALQQIPAGQVISYSELARRVHRPRAVRAVAGACAANTCAMVIPCHRVVRQDGSLSGYRWGEARKRELLRREGHNIRTCS